MAEGGGVGKEEAEQPLEAVVTKARVERVTLADLRPVVPEVGGTSIILQRNAKDDRSENAPDFGALVPEEAIKAKDAAKEYFKQIFEGLSSEDRTKVDILVVAADTKLTTPTRTSEHKRAVETAEQVLQGAKEAMTEYALSEEQLLNKTGQPIELSSRRLVDLKMMEENPQFVDWLRTKNTNDGVFNQQGFWVDYENDEGEVRDKRIEMRVEGPDEIADRVNGYIGTLSNAMRLYHQTHPDRRVIVWADGHYDSISPWLKLKVVGMEKTDYLPADQGAGIVMNIGKDHQIAQTQIAGQQFSIPLRS